MTKLTDPGVFQARMLCTSCGLDLAHYDEHTPRGPCRHEHFEPEDTRRLLPMADTVKDIPCQRAPGHEAPGREAGGALVALEQRFIVHSPDGFEWGYGGSGPADLALNVLALYVPPPEAWRLHQRFKAAFIAPMPRAGGVLRTKEILEWIRKEWDDAA